MKNPVGCAISCLITFVIFCFVFYHAFWLSARFFSWLMMP